MESNDTIGSKKITQLQTTSPVVTGLATNPKKSETTPQDNNIIDFPRSRQYRYVYGVTVLGLGDDDSLSNFVFEDK